VLEPLRFAERELALFAVNDNPDAVAASGGLHWSLLAYHRANQRLLHFDSGGGANAAAARRLAAALKPFLAPGTSFGAARCAHQGNSHACGDYVVAFAERLAAAIARAAPGGEGGVGLEAAARGVTDADAAATRRRALALALELQEEQRSS
jgi:hypothetical protein